ncbi:MAG: acetyl-CoA C-acyltransferase [Methylococcales bacterium]|nr:acetyl-CoA C-acyltransferase [Methylococcales bacterium]MEE2767378.1 acetyl-CoA C-acyltransferase [Pseudomonadota bacterium]
MDGPNQNTVIAAYARTPIGKFQGCLRALSGPQLGSVAIRAACERARVNDHVIDEVLMGCVLTAGLGQAPARQAALGAGLPVSLPCTTINKMCGSGMKAVMLGHDLIQSGSGDIVVAGGMESMSNAPYLLNRGFGNRRLGHSKVLDHIYLDGLEDPDENRLMGCYAEECAEDFNLSRKQQDDYARHSLERVRSAMQQGCFDSEIQAVPVNVDDNQVNICSDEQPVLLDSEKISTLKSAFKPNGTVTAANSSSISDGAAALLLLGTSAVERNAVEPLGRIVCHYSYASKPAHFIRAPVFAIQGLLNKVGMDVCDIDLFEINEAFAVVPLLAMKECRIPHAKLNVHGGACALGHPIGASGARILVTLCAALARYNLHRGIAAICIGGGEATAVMVER